MLDCHWKCETQIALREFGTHILKVHQKNGGNFVNKVANGTFCKKQNISCT